MKPTEESEVIAEQAFRDEDNLRMAAKVALAFPSIKTKIIKDFIPRLVANLQRRLGKDWTVTDYWSAGPLQKGCQVALAKSSWMDRANIGLEADRGGPSQLLSCNDRNGQVLTWDA